MSCLPWPCCFGAVLVLFILLEPVVYLGVVHLLGVVRLDYRSSNILNVRLDQPFRTFRLP